MNQLLIVDDEPIIVNSICHLLQEAGLEVEMVRAYNAYEALEAMRRTRIDLVISDIHMPGLNGIEMHEQMMKQWPYSKIIFLTGYNEFEFAQRAIRAGGTVDYLLKNQNDAALVSAVQKALDSIQANDSIVQQSLQAAGKLQVALPALQKEVLQKVLRGELSEPVEMRRQLARAEIELDPALPVGLMLARVDAWEDGVGSQSADRELLLYACGNIMAEYLGASVRQVSVALEEDQLLWIVQPAQQEGAQGQGETMERGPEQRQDRAGDDLNRRLPSIAEAVQEACARWLRVPLSFALAASPCTWEEAGAWLAELSRLLHLGRQQRQLLVRSSGSPSLLAGEVGELGGATEGRAYGESVQSGEFAPPDRIGTHGEAAKGMEQGEDTGTGGSAPADAGSGGALEADGSGTALPPMISKLQVYIQQHLGADLSLTRLAELVHHSPTYLSRLYKQATGTMLFEYITEQRMGKAKQLLRDSHLRIYEVAEAVGYESAPHFIRFFKKRFGITPQNYRDQQEDSL